MAKVRRNVKDVVRKRISDYESRFRAEVAEEVRELAEDGIKQYDEIVDDWEHKPKFKEHIVIGRDYVELTIKPTGDEETVKIFHYVDKGTKAHIIQPKDPNGWLVYQKGYSPHTAPGGKFKQGDGQAHGTEWGKVKFVEHPGTEARDFSKFVSKKILPAFRRGIENAFRRATRR